jgi:hypothetical protein
MPLLAESALQGEEMARESGLKMELAELLAWKAVSARHDAREAEAANIFRTAVSQTSRLRMPPNRAFFDALCAFHELGDRIDSMLLVRRHELESIQGMGRIANESRCRNRVCALLARMGEPFDDELTAAREAARLLKKPEAALEELDRIEGSRL